MTLGAMTMPADFPYQDVFQRGAPSHDRFDDFSIKHPPMDPGKWAKIFSPFDALRGFREAVTRKEAVYTERVELCDRELEWLDQRLRMLRTLTRNHRMAVKNKVRVCITYFVPCFDTESVSYGRKGSYETASGVVLKVDERNRVVYVGGAAIPMDDILRIESDDPRLYDAGLECEGS